MRGFTTFLVLPFILNITKSRYLLRVTITEKKKIGLEENSGKSLRNSGRYC